MKEKILLIWKHLKQGTLKKMWKQTLWIYQYGRRYWKAMILYTLLGLVGTGVSLVSSLISKDLVDIITGHQTGKLVSTFAAMIGFSVANILVSQASGYASTFINLKVDSEIKNDIFAKMLVTDWESLTDYHTGDLVTRWSSDASNISSGILNWIPNLIIYTFRFISALAIVLYQIIGKLIAVNRNSREFTVGNPFYKFVSSLWLFMLPVRPFCFKLSAFLRKLHHS